MHIPEKRIETKIQDNISPISRNLAEKEAFDYANSVYACTYATNFRAKTDAFPLLGKSGERKIKFFKKAIYKPINLVFLWLGIFIIFGSYIPAEYISETLPILTGVPVEWRIVLGLGMFYLQTSLSNTYGRVESFDKLKNMAKILGNEKYAYIPFGGKYFEGIDTPSFQKKQEHILVTMHARRFIISSLLMSGYIFLVIYGSEFIFSSSVGITGKIISFLGI